MFSALSSTTSMSMSKQELLLLQNLKASLISIHLNGGKPE